MKNHFYLLLPLVLALAACQAITSAPTNQQTPQPALTSTKTLRSVDVQQTASITVVSPSATSSPTISSTPAPAATPMPAIRIDLSRFDLDMRPPIVVLHRFPLIAKSNETIALGFGFACAYMGDAPGYHCNPTASLFVSYGDGNASTSLPLNKEINEKEGIVSWITRLPATDTNGETLRNYYVQVNDPQAGLDIRYPTTGAIDLFVVSEFIPIDLPAQKPVEPGKLALELPWGDGPEAVGLRKREGYPLREGPIAMDVADDGRIALFDIVNQRVLIYSPIDQGFTSIPLPFPFRGQEDLQFDGEGQLAIFDKIGEPIEQPTVSIPHLYRMAFDGSIQAVAPVFAFFPAGLTKELEVLDSFDNRLVEPFNSTGEANSRETQRKRRNPNLLYRYVEGLDPYVARFADVEAGLAFELHSVSPLGAITYFEKTPPGYLVVFHADQIRAVWFDSSGNVLKDVTLPNHRYSEVNALGQVAIDESGSLYVLGSIDNGIEVQVVKAP